VKNPFPLSSVNVSRILIVLVVIFAIAAGFFQNAYNMEKKRYTRLLNKYDKLESQLNQPAVTK